MVYVRFWENAMSKKMALLCLMNIVFVVTFFGHAHGMEEDVKEEKSCLARWKESLPHKSVIPVIGVLTLTIFQGQGTGMIASCGQAAVSGVFTYSLIQYTNAIAEQNAANIKERQAKMLKE
jgi:hydrogenase/urease accessory protein HupE